MSCKGVADVAPRSFGVLEVCSGYGGLGLALDVALGGARVVCHVEREAHAAAILAARMEDGGLHQAPIWSDLATFDGAAWRGCVDIVAAGLPCQPYSLAGKRAGHADERAIWPDFCRVVEEVAPAAIFIENVPAFLALFEPVALRLEWLGYRIETPLVIGAEDVGASHRRRRVFILAHATGERRPQWWAELPRREGRTSPVDGCDSVAHSDRLRESQPPGNQPDEREWTGDDHGAVGITSFQGVEERSIGRGECPDECDAGTPGDEVGLFAPGPSDPRWADLLARCSDLAPAVESGFRGMAHGYSSRVDRLRAVGNGVVPLQAAVAFRFLAACAGLVRDGG